jgi:ferredoxin-NADP reductase
MLAKKYRSRVVSIKNHFEGIYTLEFESLNGKYTYRPGQFLHLAIDSQYDGSDQWPESRCFSMQSNPIEANIKITYSVKGRFTMFMVNTIRIGSEVWLKLPYGDLFSQDHNKINTVFIAGGTGITPFLSLFTNPSFTSYIKPVLFAGFRNEAMNMYSEQIKTAGEINPGLEVHNVYQDLEGPLNIDTIFNMSHKNTSFFISGPPVMINTFKLYLLKNGLSADQIKTDDWE